MPRPPRPDDLYRLRIATEPRLSPDGRWVVVTLQTVAPTYDGYRTALWLVATDRGRAAAAPADPRRAARPPSALLAGRLDARVPLGPADDRRGGADARRGEGPRGRDAGPPAAARRRRGAPPDRPAARRDRLRMVARRHPARRDLAVARGDLGRRPPPPRPDRGREPGTPPPSDYRFIDRLRYMLNGADFIYDRIDHLWLVDVATGVASRLTDGPVADTQPAWSPDGRRIAFTSDRGRDPDLVLRSHIHVVDVATRAVTAITAGQRSMFGFADVDAGRATRCSPWAAGCRGTAPSSTTCGSSRRTARTPRRPAAATSRAATT